MEALSQLIEVDGALGYFWISQRDLPTLYEMLYEQSREVYNGTMAEVEPGDVVLDSGANVGVYTRAALKQGASLVVAIDPGPQAIECLRRNLAREITVGRVIIYGKGVWNEEAKLELSQDPDLASTANSVAIDRGGGGPVVELTTIDKLVAELDLERVDFIKMDIEGAEPQALIGAGKTVTKFNPKMAIALEHRPSDPDSIPALVDDLYPGYRLELSDCEDINGSVQPEVLFLHSQ